MKKIFSLILCILILFPFVTSCKKTEVETKETLETNTNATEEVASSTEEATPLSASPLTWDRINAIPIANDSMTEDELRQIVTDFFRLTLSFVWTPNQDVEYVISSKNRPVYLPKGTLYGGLPYVTGGTGNIYKIMSYYDPETRTIDIEKLGLGDNFKNVMGTQCSFSSTWAWARVSNHVKNFRTTAHMTQANGCYRVGEYTYDDSYTQFSGKTSDPSNTTAIIKANGEQVMYRSLACLKPADGLVSSTGSHVRMASSVPKVVYNPDGTIDGNKSTVTYLDQPTTWKDCVLDSGEAVKVQGGLDVVVTFKVLLDKGYIPFTIPEFLGLDPVEKGEARFSVTESSANFETLNTAKIETNYPISNLLITVKDPAGNVLVSYDPNVTSRNTTYYVMMGIVILPNHVLPYANGENTITIDCRISTGENITVYKGILAAS